MTFPDTALGVHVELAFGADPDNPSTWEWTDVSGWTFDGGWSQDPYASRLVAQDIQITRGRADESSQPAPASTSVVLDNRDGLLTPGKLGGLGLTRGTPMRVWVHDGGEHVRFVGFVDEIHPSWPYGDLSEDDGVYLPWYTDEYPTTKIGGESVITITASSILRRLGQGQKPIRSPIARHWPRFFGTWPDAQYWPLEEIGRYAEPAYGEAPPGTFTGAWETTDTLPGSLPLPWLPGRDSRGGFSLRPNVRNTLAWTAVVSVYIPESQPDSAVDLFTVSDRMFEAPFALAVPPGYPPFDSVVLRALTLSPNTPTIISASVLQAGNTVATGVVGAGFVGRWVNIYVSCLWSAATGTQLTVGWYSLNMLEHQSWTTNFLTTSPNGPHLRSIRRPSSRGAEGGIGYGHVLAYASETPIPWVDHESRQNPYLAHPGERASTRLERLAADTGVDLDLIGPPSSSVQLGPEPSGTFLDVAQDAAEADLGILADDLDGPGLVYRGHSTLYNQEPHIFDAGRSEIANPFAPVLDDQRLRNDITAKNDDASARAADEPSIARIGHYDTDIEVNVSTWALRHQASWRLRMGTWDGFRYPTVTVDMLAAHTEPAEMISRWVDVRLGDLLRITNLPPQHPGDVELIVEGWTETLSPFGWTVEMSCSPGGPWRVGVIDESRLDSATSVLAAPVGELDQTIEVTGEWADDAPYDLVIGGERMTVTVVSGSTLTVTRDWGSTVDHPAGTPVRVADPFVIALGGAP